MDTVETTSPEGPVTVDMSGVTIVIEFIPEDVNEPVSVDDIDVTACAEARKFRLCTRLSV